MSFLSKHNQNFTVAVLGSAFNPPTRGHIDLIEQILPQVDQVWLVPAIHHAWGKEMAEYGQRCAMTESLVADIANERVRLKCVEESIYNGKDPVFTFDLLNYLQQQYGEAYQFRFVVGPDNAQSWHKFFKADEIDQRWGVLIGQERQAVRSTRVRASLSRGEDIDSMVSPGVARYLKAHALYR